MATYKRFEELPIWQQARLLSKDLYLLIRKGNFSNDYRFISQITSAAGSIMDNVAEGFEREGQKEYIQFLYIAKGSAGEVRSQLYRALDAEYISNEEFSKLLELTINISSALANYINYLKQSGYEGNKYR